MLWRARPGLLCAVLARPALWRTSEPQLSLVAAAGAGETDLTLLAGSLGGQLDGIVHCYGVLLRTGRSRARLDGQGDREGTGRSWSPRTGQRDHRPAAQVTDCGLGGLGTSRSGGLGNGQSGILQDG